MEAITLHDKIIVYRGLLPNAKLAVELLKDAESNPENSTLFGDWKNWGTFGKYVLQLGNLDKDLENSDKEKYNVYLKERLVHDEVMKAFFSATENWLAENLYEKEEDWRISGPSYSRYFISDEKHIADHHGLTMVYHTDYMQLRSEEPGDKFILTCTMYLNDDYSGGDIAFIVKESDNDVEDKEIVYKPQEGDVIVFPSGHPDYFSKSGKYLHAVKAVTSGTKYLIRCFYQKPYSGSAEWHKNLQKYGAERWFALEEQRVREGRKTHEEIIYIKDCSI